MNRIMKITLALFCACVFINSAYAVDNGTEFGIEDDLTVLGNGGNIADPDVEIKGFRSEERRVGKECRSRWSPYH